MTTKVTFYHVRALGYCTSGIRRFAKKHNIPLSDLREGVDADMLEKTGDPFAIKAAELARRMEHGQQ